jgi:hypothetical protein
MAKKPYERPAVYDDVELISIAARVLGIDVPVVRVDHDDDNPAGPKAVLYLLGGKRLEVSLTDLADHVLDAVEAAVRPPKTAAAALAPLPPVPVPDPSDAIPPKKAPKPGRRRG